MAIYKKWDDHSPRWKREQSRKGLTKSRWDNWLKLSQKSRKESDPFKYAAGQSIRDQRRQKLIDEAFKNFKKQIDPKESWRIQRGLRMMSNDQLRWTAKASRSALIVKVKMKPAPGEINFWWY